MLYNLVKNPVKTFLLKKLTKYLLTVSTVSITKVGLTADQCFKDSFVCLFYSIFKTNKQVL